MRQRSPWKKQFDLNELTTHEEFAEFVSQMAVITATSHARGSYASSPAQFKEVIAAVLGRYPAHKAWGQSVARVAGAYRLQVASDFECFRGWVDRNYADGWAARGHDKDSKGKGHDDGRVREL